MIAAPRSQRPSWRLVESCPERGLPGEGDSVAFKNYMLPQHPVGLGLLVPFLVSSASSQ